MDWREVYSSTMDFNVGIIIWGVIMVNIYLSYDHVCNGK